MELLVITEMSIDELADLIEESVSHEDLPKLIALIDKKHEMWKTTLILYKHFAALKDVYLDKELLPSGDVDDLDPELIVTK